MPDCNCRDDYICCDCIVSAEPQMSRGYNSFSGVDISAVFNGRFEDIQEIEYRITRESAPLYEVNITAPEVRALMEQMEVVYG